jgi:hypothetical protein
MRGKKTEVGSEERNEGEGKEKGRIRPTSVACHGSIRNAPKSEPTTFCE